MRRINSAGPGARREHRFRRGPADQSRAGALPRSGHDQAGAGASITQRSPTGCCRTSRTGRSPWCAAPRAAKRVLLPEARDGWGAAAVGRVQIPEKRQTGTATFTYIDDVAGLIAMARWGCWRSTPGVQPSKSSTRPDLLIFDLDPESIAVGAGDRGGMRCARRCRDRPGELSEDDGWQGTAPGRADRAEAGWDAVKEFAKRVAEAFVTADPDRYTDNMAKRARAGGFSSTTCATAAARRPSSPIRRGPGRRAGRDAALLGGGRRRESNPISSPC